MGPDTSSPPEPRRHGPWLVRNFEIQNDPLTALDTQSGNSAIRFSDCSGVRDDPSSNPKAPKLVGSSPDEPETALAAAIDCHRSFACREINQSRDDSDDHHVPSLESPVSAKEHLSTISQP